MKDDYSIYVLTTDTDHGESNPYEGIASDLWTNELHPDIKVYYLPKATLSAKAVKKQIDAVQPDFVYLNHLFSPLFVVYPLWLKFRGRLKGEIVLCPRGALYESALSVKRWKKTPFLQFFRWMGMPRRILSTRPNKREKDAVLQHFPGSKVLIADNLPNMRQLPFDSLAKSPGTLKCIFIARIVPIKNLLFLLNALEKAKDIRLELTVIGPVEDKGYWNECGKKIATLPGNISVNYLGPRGMTNYPPFSPNTIFSHCRPPGRISVTPSSRPSWPAGRFSSAIRPPGWAFRREDRLGPAARRPRHFHPGPGVGRPMDSADF